MWSFNLYMQQLVGVYMEPDIQLVINKYWWTSSVRDSFTDSY